MPCILNAANEVAVKAFLDEKIGFMQMPQLALFAMNSIPFIDSPTLADLVKTNDETVLKSREWVAENQRYLKIKYKSL